MEGLISVSATNSFGEIVISEILLSFQKKYPKIQINLDLSDNIRDLKENSIDLCIRGGNITNQELVAIPLLNWQMFTVATPEYLQKFGTPSSPEELKEHNCIGHKHGMTALGWPYIIDAQYQRIKVTGDFTVSRNPLIKHTTLLSKGVAWMPSYVVEKEVQSGSLVRVLGDFAPSASTFYLVYTYQKAIPFRQRCFIEFIKNWFSVANIVSA